MGIYALKPRFQQFLQPITYWLITSRVHPDALTVGAVLLSSLAGLALTYAGTNLRLLILVPPALLLRLVFNALDGELARARSLASPWGEVKNEFGDRLSDMAIFAGIAVSGYANHILAVLALCTVLASPYLGILSKAVGNERTYAGVMGKPDRMFVLSIFTCYALFANRLAVFNYCLGMILFLSLITIGQRMVAIYATTQSSA